MSEKDADKEIDLLEVSGKAINNLSILIKKLSVFFGNIIKEMFIIIFKCVNLFFSLWKIILLFLIIGIGCSFYLYKTSAPSYHSDVKAISRIIGNRDIIQIINAISVPNMESSKFVRNDLNLPPEVYSTITKIQGSWLIDTNNDGISDLIDIDNDYEFAEKDSLTSRINDQFNIRLTLNNLTYAQQIEEALFSYLRSHPYISDLNNARITEQLDMAAVYTTQANILDSLQNTEYFSNREDKVQTLKLRDFDLVGSEDKNDIRLYHDEIIVLKGKAIASNSIAKYNKESIVLIGSFTNISTRDNTLFYYAKRVLMFLFPLGFILALFIKKEELLKIFHIDKIIKDYVIPYKNN